MKKKEIQDELTRRMEGWSECPLCGCKKCYVRNKRVECDFCHNVLIRYRDGVFSLDYLDVDVDGVENYPRLPVRVYNQIKKWLR